MYVYKNSNKGRNSLLPINNYGTLEIEVLKLDDFIQQKNLKQVRFVKIDIEGYEYFALQGAKIMLEEVELLMMEFAPGYMKKGNVNPKDVLALLQQFRFHPHVLDSQQLNPVSYEQLLQHENNIDLYLLKENQQILLYNLIQ